LKSITIFIPTLAAGGAEKQAVLLSKVLKEDGRNVNFIVFYKYETDTKLKKELTKYGIPIFQLEGNNIIKIISYFRRIKRSKPDIILNYLLLPNILGGVAGRIFKITSIGGIRSSHIPRKKILLYRLVHNHLTKFTIYNNNAGRDFTLRKGFKDNKCEVIQNAIKPCIPFVRIKNEIPIILSVGRFTQEKDYHTSLAAIELLHKKGQSFRYIIVGWGKLKDVIHNIIDQNNLNERVEIVENPVDLEYFYKSADIYLQTSLFEGLSNTVMEAMNYSLPVVVTDVGDNSRLVIEKNNGHLCPIGDYQYISEKLSALINDENLRSSYGQYSLSHISENYSIEIFKEKYIRLLEKL